MGSLLFGAGLRGEALSQLLGAVSTLRLLAAQAGTSGGGALRTPHLSDDAVVRLATLLARYPGLEAFEAVARAYPYRHAAGTTALGEEGAADVVRDTLLRFGMRPPPPSPAEGEAHEGYRLLDVARSSQGARTLTLGAGGAPPLRLSLPAGEGGEGWRAVVGALSEGQRRVVGGMLLDHGADMDMCVMGECGGGKSTIVRAFAAVLGYRTARSSTPAPPAPPLPHARAFVALAFSQSNKSLAQAPAQWRQCNGQSKAKQIKSGLVCSGLFSGAQATIHLFEDMSSRDLSQRRSTDAEGATVWESTPLVRAALLGELALLDGAHRVPADVLAVVQRLLTDRDLDLADGARLMRAERYERVRLACGLDDDGMAARRIFRVHPHFRVVLVGAPPAVAPSPRPPSPPSPPAPVRK